MLKNNEKLLNDTILKSKELGRRKLLDICLDYEKI